MHKDVVKLWEDMEGKRSIQHLVVLEVQTCAMKLAKHNASVLQKGSELDYLRLNNIFEDTIIELNDE